MNEILKLHDTINNNLRKRKGIVKVSFQLLDENNKEFLHLLFSQFYPLKCDSDYFSGHIFYYGISPNFDIIDNGEMPHLYEIIIGENEDLSMSLKFVK